MKNSFYEMSEVEMMECNGGGVGIMLLIAGGALAGGFGIGWGLGYLCG